MKALKLFSLLVCICVSTLNAQTIMNIHQSNGTILQIPLNTIDSITYTINNPGNLATLSTLPIGNTTGTSATSGGNITSDGGTNITQRGVVWSTNPNPTTANSLTTNGSGIGNYTSTLTGLTANTTYYVRAYATNSAGTAYGNELSFTTTGGGSIVSNPGAGVTYGGYNYPTVVLGNGQEWMAENLKTNAYANGDPISNETDDNQWSNLTTGAWAHYNNNSQFDTPLGKLYNWYAVSDPRNLCPMGWHVPADGEWTVLTNYLGGMIVAGGKMKSLSGWNPPNTAATNESGFSGYPGGQRATGGYFTGLGSYGIWWSSSETSASEALTRSLVSGNSYAEGNDTDKFYGLSVRCIKD